MAVKPTLPTCGYCCCWSRVWRGLRGLRLQSGRYGLSMVPEEPLRFLFGQLKIRFYCKWHLMYRKLGYSHGSKGKSLRFPHFCSLWQRALFLCWTVVFFSILWPGICTRSQDPGVRYLGPWAQYTFPQKEYSLDQQALEPGFQWAIPEVETKARGEAALLELTASSFWASRWGFSRGLGFQVFESLFVTKKKIPMKMPISSYFKLCSTLCTDTSFLGTLLGASFGRHGQSFCQTGSNCTEIPVAPSSCPSLGAECGAWSCFEREALLQTSSCLCSVLFQKTDIS